MFPGFARLIGFAVLLAPVANFPARAADMQAPDYTVIQLHVEVNQPAAEIWKRVGGCCAISAWLKVTCSYQSGSGDVGSVRVINGTNVEPMVGKTPFSYTYWQTAGNMAPTSYHGTLAVEPEGAHRSQLLYTLFYNQAALPTAADRAAQHQRLSKRFQEALDTMKKLAESQP